MLVGRCRPPTWLADSSYQIIQGSLDDIDSLPTMRGLHPEHYGQSPCIVPDDFSPTEEPAEQGSFWKAPATTPVEICMTEAADYRIKTGATIERSALIEAARRCNADCVPPLPD